MTLCHQGSFAFKGGASRAGAQGLARWLIAGALGLLVGCTDPTPVGQSPGDSNASHQPQQSELQDAVGFTHAQPLWSSSQVRVAVRAQYELAARVVSTERYYLGELASVTPVDFALAWGPASAARVQEKLSVSQGMRWYHWSASSDLPVSPQVVSANMANVHIVPATPEVLEAVMDVDQDTCIWMAGALVDLVGESPELSRRTSLTRTDSGAGACEIFLVSDIRRVPCPVEPVP